MPRYFQQADNIGLAMRILWVADKIGYGDRLHGVGAYLKYVIPALPENSVVPIVLRCNESLQALLADAGVDLLVPKHRVGDPRTLYWLLETVQNENIDIMHLHGYGASTFGRIVAMMARKPVIIHQHDSTSPAPVYGRAADYLLRNCTHRLIAVSESVAEYSIRTRSLDSSIVRVIPNPAPSVTPLCDADIQSWRSQLGIPDGTRVIGSITRFDPVKGTRYLIQALAELVKMIRPVVLVLFGDGNERPQLEGLVKELDLQEHVRFVGFQPNASRYLAAMDCFALPSLNEGLPFALLESLTSGTPAVVSGVGGIPEFLRHEESALLVPPGDPSALARELYRLLTDELLADRISSCGQAVSRQLGLERHVDKLIGIYNEALSGADRCRVNRN